MMNNFNILYIDYDFSSRSANNYFNKNFISLLYRKRNKIRHIEIRLV